jgi:hypothetical protein
MFLVSLLVYFGVLALCRATKIAVKRKPLEKRRQWA